MRIFYNPLPACLGLMTAGMVLSQYSLDYDQVRHRPVQASLLTSLSQYPELDRQYNTQFGGRRQDVIQGQFVDVMQGQQEQEAELVDAPVPVVIRGDLDLRE